MCRRVVGGCCSQVACNALVPTVLAVAAAYLTGGRDVLLQTSLGRLPVAITGAFLGALLLCGGTCMQPPLLFLSFHTENTPAPHAPLLSTQA